MKTPFPSFTFSLFLLLCVNVLLQVSAHEPLFTDSRWIVNQQGERVKLACANWPSHLETLLAEGLDKQPVDHISKKIVSLGFNCIRYTWPVALPTNDTLASTTIQDRFKSLGLDEAIAGIQVNNPEFLDLTIMDAYKAIVRNLGDNNVMVILDNHISQPGWCCEPDGNGFFGEKYFDVEQWIKGLSKMATIFKTAPNVVGMSLRNELRGHSQNIPMWHKNMQRGAETVHRANRHVLVIIGGLSSDNDLLFLKHQPVPMELTFKRKLVFEIHEYASSFKGNNHSNWKNTTLNEACRNFTNSFMAKGGFLLERGYPLFLSEFGGEQSGANLGDTRFVTCIVGIMADLDLDWAIWSLQGSYYLRQGLKNTEETYGVMNFNWTDVRNSSYMQRLYPIQTAFQGPSLTNQVAPYNVIFSPWSGFCVLAKSVMEPLALGQCSGSNNAWIYSASNKTIMLRGTDLCVQAVGVGKATRLGRDCNGLSAKWEKISDSKHHLATTLRDGSRVCLENSNGIVVTRPCKCLEGDPQCDPTSQWFKIIKSTRSL